MPMKALTAGLTALSLSFSPLAATPALAGDAEDVVQALVGVAALLVIADHLDGDNNKRKKNSAHVQKTYKPHHHRAVLPQQCLRVVSVNGHTRHVVVDRCLNRNGYHRALPGACRMPKVSRHFNSPSYRVGCLSDHGYRVAHR